VEDGSSAKVDQFDDIRLGHDAVVEFEVTVRKSDGVEILDAVAYLTEYAVDLWPTHLARHDDAKEIKRRIFHDLIVMTMITNDIDGLNDIGVFESRTDTKLCGDLLLVFLLGLTIPFRPEFLDSKDVTTVLVAGLDKAHCTTCARSEYATPFAILFSEMGLGGLGKGVDGV